ncbi:MAG TPA: Ig-like domain-containing protein [Marmoricola sp.]|nr:Ig-like domain-containing protein [Marmoricola sp.]
MSFGGITIGTVAGGTGTTPLVVTLNASATPAATQALLRTVTYADVSDNPSTSPRTVRFIVTDGDGGTSAATTRGVAVTAVNDAPVLTTSAGATAYTENDPATVIDPAVVVADLDNANLASATVQITANDTSTDVLALASPPSGISASYASATGLLTLSGSASVASYQAALRAVTFLNTSENPLSAARTITYLVNDGTSSSAAATKTVTVATVDDAPVIASIEGTSLAYTENAAATPITTTGAITDVDTGNYNTGALTVDFSAGGQAEDRLAIRNQGSGSSQIGVSGANVSYSGTALGTFTGGTGTTPLVITLTTNATASATTALLRNITYADVSDNPVTAARTVSFVLTDGHGATSTAATRGIAVTAVDDAPVITALEGTSLAYTENAAATPVTATGTVADVDSTNFSTGTLTVDFSAGGQSEDRLAIRDQGTGSGQIGVAGSDISFAGTTIGTFTGGTGTTALVITLNASATPTATQALLRTITYADVSDNPSTTARTVRFVLTDGDGATSTAATRGIAVTAVDDAPVAVADAATVAQNAAATAVPVLTNDTDIDGGPKTISSATDPAHGTVVLIGGSAGARTGLTYQPDASYCNDAPVLPDTFSYTLNGGSTATVSMTVTCVVAPVVTTSSGTRSYTEQGPALVVDSGITVTDADPNGTILTGATITIGSTQSGDALVLPVVIGSAIHATFASGVLTLSGNDTVANYQAALRTVTFANSTNDNPSATRTFGFQVSSTTATSNAATKAMAITAVDDPPVLSSMETTPLAYTEGDGPVVITSTTVVTDPDTTDFNGGEVFLDLTGFATTDDVLGVRNQGTGPGQIGVSGSTVSYGGAVIGTISNPSFNLYYVDFTTDAATLPAVQAVVRNMTWANASNTPNTTARSVSFIVGGPDQFSEEHEAIRTIDVTAVDDPPVVTTTSGSTAYTEQAAATTVDSGVTVTDVDGGPNLTGATVTIASALFGDTLAFTASGGITGSYSGGTLTLSGSATDAQYQTALRSVTYANASNDNPGSARTISFAVSAPSSNTATKTVAITPVDDPPVIGSVEGTALSYTAGAAATPITATATVADADSSNFNTGTLTIDYSAGGQAEDRLAIRNQGTGSGQIGVSGSSVTFGGTTIGTFAGGTGTTALVVTFTASSSPTAAQALLRDITYADAAAHPVTVQRTLRMVVTDGDGGTSTAVTRPLTVIGPDAAPVVTASSGSAAYTEQAAAVVVDSGLTVVDSDGGPNLTGATATIASPQSGDTLAFTTSSGITGSFASGTLTLSGSATDAQYQAALRTVTFANLTNDNPSASRTISFAVSAPASNTATKTIAITAVDDAPLLSGLETSALAYTQNDPATNVTSTVTVSDPDSADFDGGSLSVSVTGGNPAVDDELNLRNQGTGAGQVSVSGTDVSYGGTKIGTLNLVVANNLVVLLSGSAATPAAVQAVLRAVTYVNESDTPSTAVRTLAFSVFDGDSGVSNEVDRTLNVTALDAPPVVTVDAASPTTYLEQAGFQNVFGPASTLTDADSSTLSSLKVTVSSGFDSTFDTLRLNPSVTGFTSTFSGGVLTLTKAGGTVAQYQAALLGVQFSNTSDDPDHRQDGTPNPSTAQRTFSVVADDGATGGTSTAKTQSLAITPVDDPPTAPTTLPTTTDVRNTTLVSGVTTTEPHVTRTISSLTTGASDPDSPASSIAVVPVSAAATTSGGRITLTSTGTVKYEPPASNTLTSDTYGYQLTDGTAASAAVTFTVNLSGAVWYVAAGATSPEDGTAARPFDTVAAAVTASGGQTIYVRHGSGTGVVSGAATLAANQKLIGEGLALTNADVGDATAETLSAVGTKPVLTASGADVITLASGDQLSGLSINPDGAGSGIVGNGVSGVTVKDIDVTDTGTAATQPGIQLTGTGNGLTFTAPVSVSTTSAGALDLNGAALSGTVSSASVSGSTTSAGISLVNTTGSLTFQTVAVTTSGQPGFVLDNATGIGVSAGSVAATGRAAVDATGLVAGDLLNFTEVHSANSTGDGVSLVGSSTGWGFTAGAASTISGPAVAGFALNGGSAAVTYAGTIASTVGKTVVVQNRSIGSNATFSGNITGTGDGTGITVTGDTGGAVVFSGSAKTLSTGTTNAVDVTANGANAATRFPNGGLAITTTSGVGFNATGAGILEMGDPGTGSPNTVSTGTGVGVNVSGTTINAVGLVFTSVSSSEAPSGIVLANTGTQGGLSVTGTGSAASGGRIFASTGSAISLTSTADVSLNDLNIVTPTQMGVDGVGVTNFAFTNGEILGAGARQNDAEDSSIYFAGSSSSGSQNNIAGTLTITGSLLADAYGAGIRVVQDAGTITDAEITGNSIGSNGSPTFSHGSAIQLISQATTTSAVASLTKATISNNSISGFPSGDGIDVEGDQSTSGTAPSVTVGVPGSSTDVVTISGNQMVGDATNHMGSAILAGVSGIGQGNFAITNNGTAANPLTNFSGIGIGVGGAGNVTVDDVVTGNHLDANNAGFGAAGIGVTTDKNIQGNNVATLTNTNVRATVTGNTVADTDGNGIWVLNGDTNGTMDLNLSSNTVTGILESGLTGIEVDNGAGGSATYNPTMCANITNNVSESGAADQFGDKFPGITLSKSSGLATTYVFGLVGLTPSPATRSQVAPYVAGLNPNSAAGAGEFAGQKVDMDLGDNFTSCTLPAGM